MQVFLSIIIFYSKKITPLPFRSCHQQIIAILSRQCSAIAQLVEQVTVNHPVAGSSPARGAIS